MSLPLFVMLVLLGCSLGRTFVLQPSEQVSNPDTPAVKTHKCQGQSLQSIKRILLNGLNLQMEPRLPSGGLTGIRQQWKAVFSTISHTHQTRAVPVVQPESSVALNSTDQACCQMASQIFLKDLGWENWIIYPESFTFVQCASCNLQLDLSASRCPAASPEPQDFTSQMPCCQPTSQEVLPLLYMDEERSLVIASVQMTRTCGCAPGSQPLPGKD